MKKICFVLPYFTGGDINKMPNYFRLFLESCKCNETINWILVSDIKLDEYYNIAKNIRCIFISFDKFKDFVQSKYDFAICLNSPYDLCDFKVAYGELFEEELCDYDFWGFCDCDLIFGDIRRFITDDILNKYDKIFMRGHCTLFRNNKQINRLYRSKINGRDRYKEVFSKQGAFHFDEGLPDQVEGINMIFDRAGIGIYDSHAFMDVEVSRWDFIQADFQCDANEKKIAQYSYFNWNNGILERMYLDNNVIKSIEYMYIHLQKRKMKVSKDISLEKFSIIPNSFVPYLDNNIKLIKKTNCKKIYWRKKYERIYNKIIKTVGNIKI